MFPFTPMLSNKTTLEDVIGNMGGPSFWVETKLDGERMILHKRRNEYKWFSRKTKDYTDLYGGDSEKGCLAVHIHGLFDAGINKLSFRCEWMRISDMVSFFCLTIICMK